ncbi:LytR/AlgR family response regulator transcription factor [Ruminococcus flavefaciens]|uniref:Stage 0 sporulation protein A homolog n=1 Tax=Ruminococcus flavefaciens TaxID=1265 RepID=A0A315XUG5_RUMFL|nr:LytTR family DNA-binding domain-containing protein [Ruminococcus flavefaciens]PWJ09993.1 LytTR family two component transcriptional regulator [Ruminococcus flavefaciens]SSA52144.1 two component transcriptional regulator, LytTR family [Ruminococcus flavefaciens]
MLKIAIVDDENKFITIYKKIICDTFSEYHVVVELETFNTGKDFKKSLAKNKYDLVFMDIDMPEISGIDIASELRNNNQNFDLIFVSAHPHFVFETIKFTPYRFIRKTNLKSETIEAISSYCSRTQIKYKMLSLELQNGDSISEKVNDIIQFFAVRHDVYYTNKSEKDARILSRKYSLSQLEQLTKTLGFIRVHKSYLVNYRFIRSINAKSLLMSDGSEIPISHGKKTEIQELFMKLLRNEDTL